MKKIILILMFVILLQGALAINLDIEKQSSDEIIVLDLNTPVTFNFSVTNNGPSDNFLFYTFFGMLDEPKDRISIKNGETKEVSIKILPTENLKEGTSTFDLFVQGGDKSEISERLSVKITSLENSFIIGATELEPESSSLGVYIENKMDFEFKDLDIRFSSVFFDFNEKFDLGPNERKTFSVELDKEDFKKVKAGFYTVRAQIKTMGAEAETEGVIKFSERDVLNVSKKKYGFFINTEVIEKTNAGNTVQSSETIIKKNIISRLFTSFSPEPDLVEREGARIYYSWIREIPPGESLRIKVTTNWFMPLLIIFLIVATVVLSKKYLKRNLKIRKKVSFVKAKGGEFALKVSIIVNAQKHIENVNITDRLPSLVKIYERFGKEIPSRYDEKKRIIEWNFEELEAREVRVLSYIIYSKVGVVGKFALPSANAIYEKDGKIEQTESNIAYFVAEQAGKEED